jgi:hypothetical protein
MVPKILRLALKDEPLERLRGLFLHSRKDVRVGVRRASSAASVRANLSSTRYATHPTAKARPFLPLSARHGTARPWRHGLESRRPSRPKRTYRWPATSRSKSSDAYSRQPRRRTASRTGSCTFSRAARSDCHPAGTSTTAICTTSRPKCGSGSAPLVRSNACAEHPTPKRCGPRSTTRWTMTFMACSERSSLGPKRRCFALPSRMRSRTVAE